MDTNMPDPDADSPDGFAPDEQPEFHVESLRLHGSGKVTIPARLRDIYDIEHNDVVMAVVFHEGGGPFAVNDIQVQSDGRITIPDRQRILHGVEDGDTVDMTIRLTDMVFPDEE